MDLTTTLAQMLPKLSMIHDNSCREAKRRGTKACRAVTDAAGVFGDLTERVAALDAIDRCVDASEVLPIVRAFRQSAANHIRALATEAAGSGGDATATMTDTQVESALERALTRASPTALAALSLSLRSHGY